MVSDHQSPQLLAIQVAPQLLAIQVAATSPPSSVILFASTRICNASDPAKRFHKLSQTLCIYLLLSQFSSLRLIGIISLTRMFHTSYMTSCCLPRAVSLCVYHRVGTCVCLSMFWYVRMC